MINQNPKSGTCETRNHLCCDEYPDDGSAEWYDNHVESFHKHARLIAAAQVAVIQEVEYLLTKGRIEWVYGRKLRKLMGRLEVSRNGKSKIGSSKEKLSDEV